MLIEHGTRVPNVETVLRLARALNCKVSVLMAAFDREDLSELLSK